MSRKLSVVIASLLMMNYVYAEPVSLDDLKQVPPHPRLFVTAARWDALRLQVKTDPVSARLCSAVLTRADQILQTPVVVYQKGS